MTHISGDDQRSLRETAQGYVRELYTAVEQKNAERIGGLAAGDVFVFGSAADAVCAGTEQLVAYLHGQFERAPDVQLRVQATNPRVSLCDSGCSAWFHDQPVIGVAGGRRAAPGLPVRVTGLLERDSGWRLAAAYWSLPLRSNEYQFTLLKAGKLPPGVALGEHVAPEVQPMAQSVRDAMAEPRRLPELYSAREDAVTIGSTVDEVFPGPAGKAFVEQIAGLPLKFALRGGIRGAASADGCTAWMAAHMDLSGGLSIAYRFFYVWLREQDGWKIVLSHNAASVDPFNPGFEVP